MKQIVSFADKHSRNLLRFSLSIILLWSGLLKLLGVSPLYDLIHMATPAAFLSLPGFYSLLSLMEICSGLLLLLNLKVRETSIFLICYLGLTTLLMLVKLGFSPYPPILTIEGELAIRNIGLIAAAFSLISGTGRKSRGW